MVCDPEKIHQNGVYGAPDLVAEVLSPSTMKRDKGDKKTAYEQAGVREYWIVDPIKQRVTVHHFDMEDGEEYAFGEEIPVGIFEGFSIKV